MAFTVPQPRTPLNGSLAQWYERGLGWAVSAGPPVQLLTGVRFDVLELPATAGYALLRRYEQSGPVALVGRRMRWLVAAGSADELPGLLDWLEWGGVALARACVVVRVLGLRGYGVEGTRRRRRAGRPLGPLGGVRLGRGVLDQRVTGRGVALNRTGRVRTGRVHAVRVRAVRVQGAGGGGGAGRGGRGTQGFGSRGSRGRGSRTYVPRTYVPRTYVPRTYVPRTYVPRTYVPRTYVPRTHRASAHRASTHRASAHRASTHRSRTHRPSACGLNSLRRGAR